MPAKEYTCQGCGTNKINAIQRACVPCFYRLNQDQRCRLDSAYLRWRARHWRREEYEEEAREIFQEVTANG